MLIGPMSPNFLICRKEKSRAVRMMYDYSTLLEHFRLFRTLATHGIDYQTIYNYTSSRNGCMCKPQVKKFVNEDGVLHYITKE